MGAVSESWGVYESNVIDTTDCSLEETVSMVMKKVADGTALLW